MSFCLRRAVQKFHHVPRDYRDDCIAHWAQIPLGNLPVGNRSQVHMRLNFPPPFAVSTVLTILRDYLHYWHYNLQIGFLAFKFCKNLETFNSALSHSNSKISLLYSLMATPRPHFHHNAHEPRKVQSPTAKAESRMSPHEA